MKVCTVLLVQQTVQHEMYHLYGQLCCPYSVWYLGDVCVLVELCDLGNANIFRYEAFFIDLI